MQAQKRKQYIKTLVASVKIGSVSEAEVIIVLKAIHGNPPWKEKHSGYTG